MTFPENGQDSWETKAYRAIIMTMILGNFAFTFLAWKEVALLNAKLSAVEAIMKVVNERSKYQWPSDNP